MTRLKHYLMAAAGLVILLAVPTLNALGPESTSPNGAVHALFNLQHPETAPFPSDIFTVADRTHNTGRRVNLPYPDCTVHVSDCEDLDVINTLDGFGLQTRISIPFDGRIEVNTATSETVFLIGLGNTLHRKDDDDDDDDIDKAARVIGINQVVWDVPTNTLHVESDELLAQHTRYALIVTNRLRDAAGRPVEATEAFRRFRQTVSREYKCALLEAIHAARRLGVRERDIVTASVYTTQSITSMMERIRDQIKAATPDPADFTLGPSGERAVFNRADVASISWRQHTTVSPPGFTTVGLDLAILQVVPGAVATIVYGTFVAPDYRLPGGYIPAVGTRSEVPPVQVHEKISFTLFLPSGPKPATGWPVAIVGVPAARHVPVGAVASKLASRGVATIGIHTAGCGFGPLSTLTINLTAGGSLIIPDGGRSHDQDGNNTIGATEGSVAAPPRAWTIGERDGYRQTAIDLMQLVRVIEVGMDVDGDGLWDLDPNRIFHFGNSAGAMNGTMFVALEPSVSVAVESVPGGMAPEHSRWSPVRRPVLGTSLQARTPSLLNSPGITAIDGVPVIAPHFKENKPLRNLPAVINTTDGTMDIQKAFEMHEWGQQSGHNPIVWASYVRTTPLAGLYAKAVIYQFAKSDQQASNPGTTALLRAGDLADWTLHYRHDVAFTEDPAIPKNPHQVVVSPTHPNATFRSISRGMQDQIAAFFASGGTHVIHPEPVRFFEVPVVGTLPEDLNYIR